MINPSAKPTYEYNISHKYLKLSNVLFNQILAWVNKKNNAKLKSRKSGIYKDTMHR